MYKQRSFFLCLLQILNAFMTVAVMLHNRDNTSRFRLIDSQVMTAIVRKGKENLIKTSTLKVHADVCLFLCVLSCEALKDQLLMNLRMKQL